MTSLSSIADRASTLEILRTACAATAQHDYAFKFTENEEDLRACVYRYVRNGLDFDARWRVFLSYTTLAAGQSPAWKKPDMVFLRGEAAHTNVSVEILVEIKNWPTEGDIQRDVEKLLGLQGRFPEDKPALVFFGVMRAGSSLESARVVERKVRTSLLNPDGVHIWLFNHDAIYKGPWNSERHTDPYREKLRALGLEQGL